MSINARVHEIKLDLEDMNSLLERSSRQKSKDVLTIEIRKLQTELINLQNQIKSTADGNQTKPISASGPRRYDIKLNNYAWDQTNELIKIYVTLPNVHSLSKEAVYCNFSERSMDLHVIGLDNKNYELPINNLCESIDSTRSNYKVKTDMIIVNLAKKVNKNWACVTSIEKKIKDAKTATPSANDTEDPSDGLMSLMKKMYQDGDDEMKKTIAKAWTESQEKKGNSLGSFPNF